MTGLFDDLGKLALVFGANASIYGGKNFFTFAHESRQHIHVPIIRDSVGFMKWANFFFDSAFNFRHTK